MKNIKWLSILIIAVLLCFNVVLNLKNLNCKKLIEHYLSLNSSLEIDVINFKQFYLNSVFSEDYNLPASSKLSLVEDKNKTFDEITGDSKMLFFRYNQLNCHICVSHQVQLLNKFADSIGVNNICILAGEENLRNVSSFKRINEIKYEVYLLSDFYLDTLVGDDRPYYFLLAAARTFSSVEPISRVSSN